MKRTIGWVLMIIPLAGVIAGSASADGTHCGSGQFLTTTTTPHYCGTAPDGQDIIGYRETCYVQNCNEDAVPAYRNGCNWIDWCPGWPQPSDPCVGVCLLGPP